VGADLEGAQLEGAPRGGPPRSRGARMTQEQIDSQQKLSPGLKAILHADPSPTIGPDTAGITPSAEPAISVHPR
jgi:hypothetical protein